MRSPGWALLQFDWGPYRKRREQKALWRRARVEEAEPPGRLPPAQDHPGPLGLEEAEKELPPEALGRAWPICQHLDFRLVTPRG